MLPELNSVDITNNNRLPRQRPLRDRDTDFRLIIYSHGSVNRANFANLRGPVDAEIIGLERVIKNK